MNQVKIERNKLICDLYHDGKTAKEISEITKTNYRYITVVLKRDYNKFYEDLLIMPSEKTLLKYEKLKEEFLKIYQPFRYNRGDICKILKCSIKDLEYTINKYNLEFLRLKTYKSQKTLCNVPDEFFEEIKNWCIKNNTSIRKLTVTAINEYILRKEIIN